MTIRRIRATSSVLEPQARNPRCRPGDVDALARIIGDEALRARLAANAAPALGALTDFDAMVEICGRIFADAAAP